MTIGVVLCLIIITGRIIINKHHEEVEESSKDEPKFHKSNTGETTITKGFSGDNICDMEGGDIDLTTPLGMGGLSAKNEVIFFFIHFLVFTLHIKNNTMLAQTIFEGVYYVCCKGSYLPSIYRGDMTTSQTISFGPRTAEASGRLKKLFHLHGRDALPLLAEYVLDI